MKKLFLFFFLAFIIASSAFSQQKKVVSGVVSGPNGPLAGISVSAKLAGNTVATNEQGKYIITANYADTLLISAIGYSSMQIPVGNRAVIDVNLSTHSLSLDDVVVVGYGTQSKRNVTGSIATINLKETENLPYTNVGQSIRGRVAGAQFTESPRPGQNGKILIRGSRSLSAGNNPLIVVDGIIFNGSLSDINPNDFKSIDILKDASAAAIYGSRAANGVVLITSKRGTTEKPTIRVNTFYGLSDWSYKVKLLTPERYIQKTLDNRAQSGLPSDPAKITDYLTTSELVKYNAGETTDPYDAVSQQGSIKSLDLSISGRTKNTNYYLSTSLANEHGLIFNDNEKRLSMRVNIENQITKWLTIGVNSSYSRRDPSGLQADLRLASYATPWGTWYFPDGEPTHYVIEEDQIPGNPMRGALLRTNEEVYNNLFTNFYAIADLPFISGLTFRVNYSPNLRWQHNYNFDRQDIHEPQINNTMATKMNREDFDWVLENILTYSKTINKNHSIDLTLLYGQEHQGFESTQANSTRLSSEALGWNNLGLGDLFTNTSSASAVNGTSFMARLNYRLKNKYIVTLTGRRDGSSVFAENNKYATFPSVGFGWIISDEHFMEGVPFVNTLKLRLSNGVVGNQAISPYQSLSLSATTRYVYGDGGPSSLGVYPSNMSNSDLKWETTNARNAAIDFGLFKNRLSGTIEVYSAATTNLLVKRILPNMTGFSSIWTNLGKVSNKGVEFTLSTVNIDKGKFTWNTDFVFSRNHNKLIHLYNSDTDGDGKEDDDILNGWFIGKSIHVAYDYVFDGIYQEGDEMPTGYQAGFVRLKDLNKDGKIDAEDRAIVGETTEPKYRWGITNSFRYNNLSLSVFVNAMTGWISNIQAVDYSVSGSNYPHRPLNMIDAGWWTKENKSNDRPSMVYPNPYGHGYYYSRNFVRVQDVSLTYAFPKKLLDKLSLTNLNIHLSGRNLMTFTNWIGPDPESGETDRANFFPTPRTFSLGVNVGF